MSDSAKRMLYVFGSGPYSTAAGLETLDAVMMGASFEQRVSVLFLHDGVFQLKSGQSSRSGGLKRFTNTFKALADFYVSEVYVHDLSMSARGLSQQDLIIEVGTISSDQVAGLIAAQDKVFTF